MSVIVYLYLDITAGIWTGFISLTSGASVRLIIAALFCMVVAFISFTITELFDSDATEGYVFEFLFDLVERIAKFIQ